MASSSGTSYITTASEQANELYKSNRDYNNQLTWQSYLNNNDASARAANSNILGQYNQATADAYVSSLQSKQALQNSGIVGAYKNETMAAYDASLESNLSDLKSSYNSALSSIEESRAENEESILNTMYEQAEYTADYTNAHYDYLQYLYEGYENGENSVFDSTLYQKYLGYDYQRDEEGNILTDENGNYLVDEDSAHLKSWDELSTVTKDENGEYSSIYDENGNLTQFGIDFFDQMENSWDYVNNDYYGNTSDTWSQWLKENNEDLYDWAGSYNYYNYTQAGTNAGTMRTMYGMMSTDMTYSYLERMGGMTSTQVNEYFDKVNTAIDDTLSLAMGTSTKPKQLSKAANGVVDAMEELCNDLNLGASMSASGFSWDDLRSQINDVISQGSSYKGAGSAGVGAGIELATGAAMTAGGLAAGAASAAGYTSIFAAAYASAITAGTAAISGSYSAEIALSAATLAGIGGWGGGSATAGAMLATLGPASLVVAGIATAVAAIVGITKAVKKSNENKQAISNNMRDLMSQLSVSLTDYKHSMTSNVNTSRSQIIY